MTRSSLMPWSEDGKKINPTLTPSIKEFWVLYVKPEQPPNVLYTHFSSVQDLENWLKFSGLEEIRLNLLSKSLWNDIPASLILNELLLHEMLNGAGSPGWTEGELIYLDLTWAKDGTWQCLGIFSREKPS